jgi:hypothetical protein
MIDLLEAWRILIPGGLLLVHDCFPDPVTPSDPTSTLEVMEVRKAVRDFAQLYGLTWHLISRTMYMAAMQK